MIDYTQQNFGDLGAGMFDKVFDTIGGQAIEDNAFQVLKGSGRFMTVVGPVRYIGERKLSWLEVFTTITHVIARYFTTLISGPRYIFGATLPRLTIHEALKKVVEFNITMPIEHEIAFDLLQIKTAVRLLTSHRAKGRIVINIEKPA